MTGTNPTIASETVPETVSASIESTPVAPVNLDDLINDLDKLTVGAAATTTADATIEVTAAAPATAHVAPSDVLLAEIRALDVDPQMKTALIEGLVAGSDAIDIARSIATIAARKTSNHVAASLEFLGIVREALENIQAGKEDAMIAYETAAAELESLTESKNTAAAVLDSLEDALKAVDEDQAKFDAQKTELAAQIREIQQIFANPDISAEEKKGLHMSRLNVLKSLVAERKMLEPTFAQRRAKIQTDMGAQTAIIAMPEPTLPIVLTYSDNEMTAVICKIESLECIFNSPDSTDPENFSLFDLKRSVQFVESAAKLIGNSPLTAKTTEHLLLVFEHLYALVSNDRENVGIASVLTRINVAAEAMPAVIRAAPVVCALMAWSVELKAAVTESKVLAAWAKIANAGYSQ